MKARIDPRDQPQLRVIYGMNGITVWDNCRDTLLTKLQQIQNRAARIIFGSNQFKPSAPLLETHGCKTVKKSYRQG